MNANPKMFVPSSGAWGRSGCTNVVLEKASKPPETWGLSFAWIMHHLLSWMGTMGASYVSADKRKMTVNTPEVQENFVNSCVDSATSGTAPADESDAEQLCGCMYNELKARMSFEEFKTADQSLREGEQMSSKLAATLQAAAGACT